MGYFKETVKGVSWMGGLRVSTRLIAFLRIAILARLLLPAQFGLFAIASLVLALVEILTETGINVFFIQKEGELEEYIDTAWVVSILRGIVISILIILIAPLASSFFNSPESFRVLLLIGLVPLIRGFINPAIIRFRQELQFDKEFLLRLPIFAVDALTAIILALITHSAASLVWGMVAGGILEVILSFVFIKPRPVLAFESEKAKRVVSRGKWVAGAGFFEYLFQQGDDIVVGRLLDISALGLYQLAYKVSTLPIYETGEIFNKVTFPVYAKIARNKKKLMNEFLKVTLAISALVIPFGLILFLFTQPLVLIILGERWLAAVPAVKVLAIFGIVRSISGSSIPLFLAIRKQEYVMALTGVSILGLAVSIFPLVSKYGIAGAGASALIGSLAALPVVFYYLFKTFKD